jgi:YidC/Oxa1 family membrane protein insertase
LPETHNPNLPAQNSGGFPTNGGVIQAMVAFAILAIAILFSHQYGNKLASSAPQVVAANLGVPIHTPPVIPALQAEATGQSHKPQIQFGWLAFLAKPLYLALQFLYDHSIRNWGWAIILLTLIFNLLLLWPRIMSMKSSLKMMRIQPKVDAIRKRYADLKVNDPRRTDLNTEIASIYKSEGANIFGGCLPVLLQMPLLFAYQRVLQNATELHNAHWFWLTDLSHPDPLHLLPALIIGSMFLTQFITPTPGMNLTQRRVQAILMPLIMGFTLWRYASGLALYWLTCNFFNLIFQSVINCSKLGREIKAVAINRATV